MSIKARIAAELIILLLIGVAALVIFWPG